LCVGPPVTRLRAPCAGPLSFQAQTGVFELNGLPIRLTALEWRVLECLILRKDTVVDRTVLAEKVYEGDAGTDSNSLEVIVARLRRKIGRDMNAYREGRDGPAHWHPYSLRASSN